MAGNKYGAKRTYSELCQRTFSSKAEARRGEELRLLEMAGEIADLQYQMRFILCKKPKVSITIDFVYLDHIHWISPKKGGKWASGNKVYEDVKGMGETREFRVKRIWLLQKEGIEIRLVKI